MSLKGIDQLDKKVSIGDRRQSEIPVETERRMAERRAIPFRMFADLHSSFGNLIWFIMSYKNASFIVKAQDAVPVAIEIEVNGRKIKYTLV